MCDCNSKDENTPTADPSQGTPDTEENGEHIHYPEPITTAKKQEISETIRGIETLQNEKDNKDRDAKLDWARKHIKSTT